MRWLFSQPSDEERTSAIIEATLAQRAALMRQEQDVVFDIARAFKVAEEGLNRELKKVLGRWEDATASGGRVSPAFEFQATRLKVLLHRVHEIVSDFAADAESITRKAQAARVASAGPNIVRQLKAAKVRASFEMLHEEALRDIAGFLADGRPLSALFDTIAPGAVHEAREAFVQGIAVGKNPRVIARELFKGINGEVGKVQLITRDRSLVIARTETMRAYRTATTRNYEANADVVTAWVWLSARDERTCPACLARDGTVWPVRQVMPTHPGCRCVQVPQVIGYPMNIGTGEEWVSGLAEEQQRKVLGSARFELWSRGEAKFSDFAEATHSDTWGEGLRVRSLRGLRK